MLEAVVHSLAAVGQRRGLVGAYVLRATTPWQMGSQRWITPSGDQG